MSLFYTWPLKYIGLGEMAVLIVWGPLMIGGGYFVITGQWDWNVVIAGLPYAFGVTTVIFGKHIDKFMEDKAKGIHTLPVMIGEKAGRFAVLSMIAMQYMSVLYLVIVGFFSPVMLVVLFALFSLKTGFTDVQQTETGNLPTGLCQRNVAAIFCGNRVLPEPPVWNVLFTWFDRGCCFKNS